MDFERKISVISFCLLLVIFVYKVAAHEEQNSDSILGKWETQSGEIVKIEKSENGYIGSVIDKNDMSQVKFKGLLKNLIYTNNEDWEGKLFAKKTGDFKNVKCKLKGYNKLELEVSVGMFSKKIEWKKYSP